MAGGNLRYAQGGRGRGFFRRVPRSRDGRGDYRAIVGRVFGEGFLFSVVADEVDALLRIRHVLVPVVFVFDGDVAFEALLFQLIETPGDLPDAGAVGHVVLTFAVIGLVFEMAADDAAF